MHFSMTDETRKKYLTAVNLICEQFGFNKPTQIIYVCEAVDNLIEEYKKENGKLQGKLADLESEYYELENFKENEIAKLKESLHEQCELVSKQVEQIEKIKMVASSWIMSLEDVRASEVNNRRFEVLRELEKRVTEYAR